MQLEIEIDAISEPERDRMMEQLSALGLKPYSIDRNRCKIRYSVDPPSILAGIKLMRLVRSGE